MVNIIPEFKGKVEGESKRAAELRKVVFDEMKQNKEKRIKEKWMVEYRRTLFKYSLEYKEKVAAIIDKHCCDAWKNCDFTIKNQEERSVCGGLNLCEKEDCHFYKMYQELLNL